MGMAGCGPWTVPWGPRALERPAAPVPALCRRGGGAAILPRHVDIARRLRRIGATRRRGPATGSPKRPPDPAQPGRLPGGTTMSMMITRRGLALGGTGLVAASGLG